MSEWKVWIAGPEEEDALVRLEAAAFGARSWGEKNVRGGFSASRVVVLMAGRDRETPAGFALWRDLGDEAEVLAIGVAPESRGKGAAQALMKALLEGAKAAGATRVFLEVDAGNEAALALYRATGFEKTGLRRAYYRDGADALVMQLLL